MPIARCEIYTNDIQNARVKTPRNLILGEHAGRKWAKYILDISAKNSKTTNRRGNSITLTQVKIKIKLAKFCRLYKYRRNKNKRNTATII